MEELGCGTGTETSVIHMDPTTASFELQGMSTSLLDDDTGAVVIDSGMDPYLDGNDNSQVIFKGILDQNGAFVLDSAQFAALIGSVQLENSGKSALSFISSQQQLGLPLTSSNQRPRHTFISVSNDFHDYSRSEVTEISPHSSSSISTSVIPTSDKSSLTPGISTSTADSFITNPITLSSLSNVNIQDGENNSNVENRQPHGHPNERFELEPPIGKGPYRCKDCGKIFHKWPQFKRHKAEHLDEKAYKCALCSTTFNFEANLKLHEMIHEAEISGSLECQICPAKFSRLASLKSHIRVHEKEENLVCPECGDEFATKARLDTHIEEHKTTKPLIHRCRMCGKTFTHAALLKDHAKEHSAVKCQLKILNKMKRKKQIQNGTNSNASTSTGWTKSRQKQENRKKLVCSVCSKRFQKPSQLSRHMRIHTGEKPYSCNHCGRSFNQKGTLESHVLSMHDKLKPYVCDLCNCQFSQRGNLKAHVLKVHVPLGENEKAFKCQECPCVYRRLATLNNHIAKAHTKTTTELRNNGNSTSSGFTPGDNLAPTIPLGIPLSISQPASGSGIMTYTITNSNDQQNLTLIPNASSSNNTQVTETEVTLAHELQGKSSNTATCTVKVKKIGQDKWHLCPHDCSKAFRKPSDLIRHIRIHTREKPFTCKICSKSFSIKSTLNTHLKTHSATKDWECRECHRRFSALTSLRAHERLHTGAKPFPCMQCGKCFRTSSQRMVHFRTHSRNSQGPTGKRKLLRIGDTEPVVELPDPLKITSDGLIPVPNRSCQSVIKSDSGIDYKNRPYRCSMCPSAFKKSSHLKQHNRGHSGERPYKCFQCYRSFISSGVLKNHIKTHEGVRAFKCNLCQISFTTNGSLTRHMFTHTEERSYVCPYCHKAFKTSVACRKHIKTHRSEFVAFHTKSGNNGNDSIIVNATDINPQQHNGINSSQIFSQSSIPNSYQNEYRCIGGEIVENPTDMELVNSSASVDTNSLLVTFSQDRNTSTGLSDCISMQQQIQDITELIENGRHFADGEASSTIGTIPYSSGCIDDVTHHITLAEGQSFDGSIFTLPGENIDLPVSLASLLPSSQQQPPNVNQSTSTVSNFVPVVNVIDPSASASNTIKLSYPTTKTTSDISPEISAPTSPTSNQVANRIREASRPISEQIYNEIKATKDSRIKLKQEKEQNPSNLIEEDKTKVHVCSHCGRGFRKRSDMIRHERIHTGEKPFRCITCDKSFRVKSTRDTHMRTHEGGKTVACHVCNNLFSTKSSLRVHLRLHTGSKPYTCPHCDKSFRTSGHRKMHVLSHFKTKKETPTSAIKMKPESESQRAGIQDRGIRLINKGSVVLPPVETIKDKAVLVDTRNNSSYAIQTSDCSLNTSISDPVQIIGTLQLTLDSQSSSVQNIQIAGLDLNSLQLSDEFLQSLGNVILVTPSNQLGTVTTNDIGHNILGVAVRNENDVDHNQDQDMISKQTSTVLTGKDVNVGSTSMSHQIQNSISSLTSINDLEGLISSDSNNMMSFNGLNSNSPMLSSSPVKISQNRLPVPSSSSQPTITTTLSNKQCSECGKIFAKPSLLKRHMTTHTGEKAFKCDLCSCTFNQKNSLEVHKYTHTNERPFICSLCPFKTVVKAALKKHCSRAHPDLDWNDVLVVHENAASSSSPSKQ